MQIAALPFKKGLLRPAFHLSHLLLWLLCTAFYATSSLATPEHAYTKAQKEYYALLKDDSKKKYRHHWVRVIRLFQQVSDTGPGTAWDAKAKFSVGNLWRSMYEVSRISSDLRQAARSYAEAEQVIRNIAEVKHLGDDALFWRASILLDLGETETAAMALLELLKRYPQADFLSKAKQLRDQIEPSIVAKASQGPTEIDEQSIGNKDQARQPLGKPRIWAHQDDFRLSIPIRHSLEAHAAILPKVGEHPPRLYVDFEPAELNEEWGALADNSPQGLVKRIRAAQHDPQTVRVVLELNRIASYRLYQLEGPSRIVVEVFVGDKQGSGESSSIASATQQPAAVDTAAQPTPKKKPPVLAQPAPAKSQKKPNKQRPFHVVLDPGHGGKDSGARGVKGLLEKDVVISIAQITADNLRKKGVVVSLTRTRDRFIPLDERSLYANQQQADLFVSIHANANKNKKARGVETYYLNVADDRYARRLAAFENRTSAEKLSELETILTDMLTKANTGDSRVLAEGIQKQMVTKLKPLHPKVRDLGVKGALFVVLLGARMPAVLVETSFVTNPEEGRLLRTQSYQNALGAAIATGILNYRDRQKVQ